MTLRERVEPGGELREGCAGSIQDMQKARRRDNYLSSRCGFATPPRCQQSGISRTEATQFPEITPDIAVDSRQIFARVRWTKPEIDVLDEPKEVATRSAFLPIKIPLGFMPVNCWYRSAR